MRENDQTQRIKTQGEIISERQTSNIPLMSMIPVSTINSSSFEQSFNTMSTSQTMPSLNKQTLDLTSSLLNNINSLASRPQTTVNKSSIPSLNSGTISGNSGLFQTPVNKNTSAINSKSAAAELDDFLN